jgi:hypothetical protein
LGWYLLGTIVDRVILGKLQNKDGVSAIGGDSLRDSFASRDLGGGGDSTRLGLTHGCPETGFFSESAGQNASFRKKKPGFEESECVQESK